MSAVAGAAGTGTAHLRRSVLIFGSGGALGSAVAHAFAAAQWRVIGCTSGWSGAPLQVVPESMAAGTRPHESVSTRFDERAAAQRNVIEVRQPEPPGARVRAAAGGAALAEQAAAERPKFEKWHRSAAGWRATAAPPHAVVDVAAHSFERAFSLQKQGEDLLEQLQLPKERIANLREALCDCFLLQQPLLAAGPPLRAAICCSGAFDMTPPGSPFFLDEAQRLIKANCWPALLCAHTAAMLQQEQGMPLLLVLVGAAAVARAKSTPSMIAYGCAKSYVHHLVRSLAAASGASAPRPTNGSASAAAPAAVSKTEKQHGDVGSSNADARLGSSCDKGSSHESRLHRENHNTQAEALPALRVVGLLPTILDTPSNRENMKEVSESVRLSTWTDVRDVAQQLLRWAENPEAVANGQFYVVTTRRGKTEFTLL